MEFTRPFLLLLLLTATSLVWGADTTPCTVPGYERLRALGGNWQKEAGELLFSELSCAACHHDAEPKVPSLAWKSGPDLSAAGDRLRASYVRAYLANPAHVKPGTSMPDMLAGTTETKKAEMIEDLTHFLMGRRAKKSTTEPIPGSAKTGRDLFFNVGCIACHGAQPLPDLGEKYAPGELTKFLMNPLAVRPSGRMPDQKLGKKDAAHLAAYLSQNALPAEGNFQVDEERAKRGRKLFGSMGCIVCHGNGKPLNVPALVDLEEGCLSSQPKLGVPHYSLTDEQRGALRTSITTRSKVAEETAPQAVIRLTMLQRNCFACHVRDGLGGPAGDIAAHFKSTKDDLGDLGRLPPPLDGVGRKFQRSALEAVMRGRDPVRTYMQVRMPNFGDDVARALSRYFAIVDMDANEKPMPARDHPELTGRGEWGRELVGIKGYACIACHNLNGQASLGIGAYDLAEMPKRLRPEWMRDFLLNPGAFSTGSRMPLFWLQGKPMNPNLAGGTADSQIDSIIKYLAEVDESLPPEGMADHAALVLKPTDRPIVFRTFLRGTGTHAIAVGFPAEVHVAFDALTVRWSMAWRGRFIDADGTWNQRYIKMEKPLGGEQAKLEGAGALSIVGQEVLKPQFRGYRLRPDGIPAFEYDLGALHVEDCMEPSTSRGLRRTLRVTGQTSEAVQFEAKPPANLKVKIAQDTELSVPLVFQSGTAQLVEEISW